MVLVPHEDKKSPLFDIHMERKYDLIDCKRLQSGGKIPRAVLTVLEYILIPKCKIFYGSAGGDTGALERKTRRDPGQLPTADFKHGIKL